MYRMGIFRVFFQMLGQIENTMGQYRYLNLGIPGIKVVLAELSGVLGFLLFGDRHWFFFHSFFF
jgi:hypothetical protein